MAYKFSIQNLLHPNINNYNSNVAKCCRLALFSMAQKQTIPTQAYD